MTKSICEVHRLGLIEYRSAWDLQNRFAAEVATGDRSPTLLLLEHPHTYTFGRRGEAANLLWDETELARRGVAVHWVDRGGDITYHGPGQLVGYPLLPLGSPNRQKVDYIEYIRKLEQVIIMAVAEFGVGAVQVEGLTGVWITKDSAQETRDKAFQSASFNHQAPIHKLAAIGVKVDAQGISRHGFALNVNPDMAYWDGIIGCGLDHPEISLAQLLGTVPKMEKVIEALLRAFQQVFDYEIQPDLPD
jgi:lipoate-protein ligase B